MFKNVGDVLYTIDNVSESQEELLGIINFINSDAELYDKFSKAIDKDIYNVLKNIHTYLGEYEKTLNTVKHMPVTEGCMFGFCKNNTN